MALANKDRMPNAIIQASAFYDHNNFNGPSLFQNGPKNPEKPAKIMSNSSSVSSPSSTNSNGLGYNQATSYSTLSEEGNSVITFKPEYGDFVYGGGSLLSFEHVKRVVDPDDQYLVWDENLSKCASAVTNHDLPGTSSCSHLGAAAGMQFSWLNDQVEDASGDGDQEMEKLEASNNKRPSTGENNQAPKKQCLAGSSNGAKKTKPKLTSAPSKDPQSVAAKNRRERISERLKTLQELVPNGSKVDLVTMLEKAIGYVKFLQLQVKVLATDDFWPAQGGKAPDLSQVRETIDAILASQRDRNSSSK